MAGTPTPVPTRTPTVTSTLLPTPAPSPTPTLLPPESGIIYALKSHVNRVGWVVSGEEGNHFGEAHLYTGVLEGNVYHGAFQFDISFIAPGSSIHYAAVELTGLDGQRLEDGGSWSLQMLGTDVDPEWPLHDFDRIHQASVAHTLSLILSSVELSREETHVFVLNVDQRTELEKRIARGVVSFRLDGPASGADNLFSWDTGYGTESLGKGPILRLAVAPPPVPVTPEGQRIAGLGTPTPTYVILTPVPTPENILTVAADALTATAWATMVGTPTPLPLNWVTPIIVTATPTHENEATATTWAMVAAAEAILTGTPMPTPGNVWTATPTPTHTPTSTYVVLTPAPTPENVLTAAADALTATAWATTTGTPTPLPPNWVTPIIMTATPTPANRATTTAHAMIATAEAILTGTPAPTPENIWIVTPTPTPWYVYLWELPPAELPTPTPAALPSVLVGRIAFFSNRRGGSAVYNMDADGSRVALLTSRWAYDFALPRQEAAPDGNGYLSPDGQLIVYHVGDPENRQVWIMNADGSEPRNISDNNYDEYDPIWLR